MRGRIVSAIALGGLLRAAMLAVPGPTALAASSAVGARTAQTLHLTQFRSPSGNIGCVLLGGAARCDIRHRSWSPPPRPSACPKQVGFGQGLVVGGSGRAHFVCAGDTALDPTGPAVPYGSTDAVGPFSCASATSGITCTNVRTQHGFFISVQGYRIF